MRLYEDAFKPEKSLSLKERIESMNAYFEYMGEHFGTSRIWRLLANRAPSRMISKQPIAYTKMFCVACKSAGDGAAIRLPPCHSNEQNDGSDTP